MEHSEIWFLEHCSQPQHCASCEHCSCIPCCPAFHALLFLLQFLVSSDFNPCNSFSFSFFVISLALSTYISLSLYKLTINSLPARRQYRDERQFRRCFLFSFSFIFFSIFSAAKHSSEDDNLEDGWVKLFLLEEDGCWLGYEVK